MPLNNTPQSFQLELPFTKLCECGCGQPAPIAQRTHSAKGYVKGQPVRFIPGHHVRLKPLRPVEDRFWEKVDKRGHDECWGWNGSKSSHGYGQLRINDRLNMAHRFSYELHNGPIPDGLDVLHKCDNPPCCNPNHLFVGTAKDNTADMLAKGRGSKPPVSKRKGEKHPLAVFTNAQVRELRRQFAQLNMTMADFARLHQVSISCMFKLLKHKTYPDA